MFKKAQMVMLPTIEKANKGIYLSTASDSIFKNKLEYCDFPYGRQTHSKIKQHLYIISDDNIKEGDWYVFDVGYASGTDNITRDYKRDNCKKIIATTDISLWEHDDTVPYPKTRPALPQPSQAFIEKYITEYNKGNIITDVMVEYNTPYDSDQLEGEDWDKYYSMFEKSNSYGNYESIIEWSFNEGKECLQLFNKLKINPKDNTITIRKEKDSWSREEVIKLLEKHSEMIDNSIDYNAHLGACCNVPIPNWNDDKFIEENL